MSSLCVLAKSDPLKPKVIDDAICAAGVETEDRDGYVAMLGIEITPRFQIRSRIADFDWSRGRLRLWPNQELDEFEVRDITDVGVDETDEWRWTVGHLNVSQPSVRALAAMESTHMSVATGAIHRAFMPPFVGRHKESQTNSAMRRLVTQDG